MSVSTGLVLRARAELLADLGHEPTLKAVAKCASVAYLTVHRTYQREGLDTRAGHGAATMHSVTMARAELLVSLDREPTRAEVQRLTGLSAGAVVKAYAKLGFDPECTGQRAMMSALRLGVRTQLDEARADLHSELGHDPNQSQIARRLGVSRQRVSQIVREEKALADSL